jgi:hypothetical protein
MPRTIAMLDVATIVEWRMKNSAHADHRRSLQGRRRFGASA